MRKGLVLTMLVMALFSCTTETSTYEYYSVKTISGDRELKVTCKGEETRHYGFFTNINYGTEHKFWYQFKITPGQIRWEGNLSEIPKELSFCKDTLYLKIKSHAHLEKYRYDSLENGKIDTLKYKQRVDTMRYFKHIDQRYFFNLLGKQYFTSIKSKDFYKATKGCPIDTILDTKLHQ